MSIEKEQTKYNEYPLRYSGGIFLLIVGLTYIVSELSGNELVNIKIFAFGFLLAILSLGFAKFLATGRPSKKQLLFLGSAILLQGLLILLFNLIAPDDLTSEQVWMWGNIIVGIHFLPMAVTFGKALWVVGMLCIIFAISGLLFSSIPFPVMFLADGIAKLLCGLYLLFANSKINNEYRLF